MNGDCDNNPLIQKHIIGRMMIMLYEEPNLEIVMWEDDMIPITQVSDNEGGQFGDYEDGSDLPID